MYVQGFLSVFLPRIVIMMFYLLLVQSEVHSQYVSISIRVDSQVVESQSANSRKAPCMSMCEAIIRRALSTFNDGEIRRSRSLGINCRKPTSTDSLNRAHSSQSTDIGTFANTPIPAPSLGRFFPFRFFPIQKEMPKISENYCRSWNHFLINKRERPAWRRRQKSYTDTFSIC